MPCVISAPRIQTGVRRSGDGVAATWGLPPETVRRMDKRVLHRWAASRPRKPLRYLGVDEIFLGKAVEFLTVVSDLQTGEPLWMGPERKCETLDRYFAEALPAGRRRAFEFVPQQLTSYGGLELIRRYVQRIRLATRLRQAFTSLRSDCGSPRLGLMLLALLLGGGRRLDHLRHVADDPLVHCFCGFARLPTAWNVAHLLKQFTQ